MHILGAIIKVCSNNLHMPNAMLTVLLILEYFIICARYYGLNIFMWFFQCIKYQWINEIHEEKGKIIRQWSPANAPPPCLLFSVGKAEEREERVCYFHGFLPSEDLQLRALHDTSSWRVVEGPPCSRDGRWENHVQCACSVGRWRALRRGAVEGCWRCLASLGGGQRAGHGLEVVTALV